jgi:hypothetical protein
MRTLFSAPSNAAMRPQCRVHHNVPCITLCQSLLLKILGLSWRQFSTQYSSSPYPESIDFRWHFWQSGYRLFFPQAGTPNYLISPGKSQSKTCNQGANSGEK